MSIEIINGMRQLEKRVISLESQLAMLKQQFWEINKKLNEHINNIEGHKY